MKLIGFFEEGRYFKNEETRFFIEFPPGPLGIGEEIIKEIHKIKYATGHLKLISATDCVKDRLAAYFHWGDNQCLEQAIMVASHQKIDFNNNEKWSKKERSLKKYKNFIDFLDNLNKP